MSTKIQVKCQNCEEARLIPCYHDEILIGYHCESHNPRETGFGSGCGVLVNESDYKTLRGDVTNSLNHTKQQTTTTQQSETQPKPLTESQRAAQYYGYRPTMSVAQRLMQQRAQNNSIQSLNHQQTQQQQQHISPNTSMGVNIAQVQQALNPQSQPPPQVIGQTRLTVLNPHLLMDMKAKKLELQQKKLEAMQVDKDKLFVKMQKLTESSRNLREEQQTQDKKKKLAFLPRNTSSEEELERLAEEKKKNKFRPKKRPKRKKNKVLSDATKSSKKKKNGVDGDEESEDYDDESDDDEGDWDSEQDEESSGDDDDDDDLFDEDQSIYPETAEDRLEEEADRLNALLGDNDRLAQDCADSVFNKNAVITRVNVMEPSIPWAAYGNDQYEVHRAPFVTPSLDERFATLLPVDESKKFATLGINWNSLPKVIPGATKWKPVTMIEKTGEVEKTENELAFEDYQQKRLEKALAKRPIPTDYKRLIVWSPSAETIAEHSHLTLNPIEVPPIVGHWLRPHQREGVQFLAECVLGQRGYNGNGAILADDMGLGKTLQSVALIYTLLTQGFLPNQPVCKKVIVCCPTSLVQNWANEFDKWIGRGIVYVVAMVESGDKQKQTLRRFTHGPGQVLVISYDTLRRHMGLLLNPKSTKKGKANNKASTTTTSESNSNNKVNLADLGLGDMNFTMNDNNDGDGDDENDDVQFNLCDLLICDEAHRLKNNDTQTYKSLDELPCRRRILLSGTPMQNELKEFYSMINFANPNLLGSLSQFSQKYQNPIMRGREPTAIRKDKIIGEERAYELSRIVGKFIIRRTNTLLSKHLPPKTIELVCTNLSPLQQEIYTVITQQKEILSLVGSDGGDPEYAALFQSMNAFDSNDGNGGDDDDNNNSNKKKGKKQGGAPGEGGNGGKILPMLNMLRSTSNHPKIVYDQIRKKESHQIGDLETKILSCFPDGFERDAAHPKYSGKIHSLDRLICAVRAQTNDRFVLISNFTETLDLIQQLCEFRGWKFLRVDGSTSVKNRQANVDKLCAKGSDYTIFLLSSKAGGCGLNLVGANRLVLVDPDWNPAVDKQAAGRIWRDGQQKRCFVYRLFSTGTIDEKIFQRQLSKDGLTEIMGGANQDANVSIDELRKLFVYNSRSLSDTHDTLNCNCLSPHPNIQNDMTSCSTHHGNNSKMIVGEPTDASLGLWTTSTNPFGRLTGQGYPNDPLHVRYPYQPPAEDITAAQQNNGFLDEDDSNKPFIPQYFDPSLPLITTDLAHPQNTNSSIKSGPNRSRLEPLPQTSSQSTSSQHSQQDGNNVNRLPNLLQKGWAREADLEYWSHHSQLQTIPDPCFREAILDRFNKANKLNWSAFGHGAENVRIDSRFACTSNMVSMVLALEMSGKPLADDMDGRKWRQFSSLTFRHGQPIKSIVKGNNYDNVEVLDDNGIDEEELTAAQKRKLAKQRKELEKKAQIAKFDPNNHKFDSEEDPADYITSEAHPKGKLPDMLVFDPNEREKRQHFFQRQLMKFTLTRGEYEKKIRRNKAISKKTDEHSYDDDNGSDGDNYPKKRQKTNGVKKGQTGPKQAKDRKSHDSGIDLGSEDSDINTDDDNNDDADQNGNVAGFIVDSDSDDDGIDGNDSASDINVDDSSSDESDDGMEVEVVDNSKPNKGKLNKEQDDKKNKKDKKNKQDKKSHKKKPSEEERSDALFDPPTPSSPTNSSSSIAKKKIIIDEDSDADIVALPNNPPPPPLIPQLDSAANINPTTPKKRGRSSTNSVNTKSLTPTSQHINKDDSTPQRFTRGSTKKSMTDDENDDIRIHTPPMKPITMASTPKSLPKSSTRKTTKPDTPRQSKPIIDSTSGSDDGFNPLEDGSQRSIASSIQFNMTKSQIGEVADFAFRAFEVEEDLHVCDPNATTESSDTERHNPNLIDTHRRRTNNTKASSSSQKKSNPKIQPCSDDRAEELLIEPLQRLDSQRSNLSNKNTQRASNRAAAIPITAKSSLLANSTSKIQLSSALTRSVLGTKNNDPKTNNPIQDHSDDSVIILEDD